MGGVRAAIWKHFCSRALRHDKSDKLRILFKISRMFWLCLFRFLRLPGRAGARTDLVKTGFFAWRVLHFSHVRRLRAQPNGEGTLKKTSRTTTSQRVESTRRKTSENIKTWLKMVPEAPRSPPRGALGVPKIRCWWLGGLLGRRVGRFQDSGGSLGGRRRVAGTAPEPLRQLFGN